MSRFDPFRDFPPSPPEVDWQARALAAEATVASLTEALEAVDSEVLLSGNLKDIVDAALDNAAWNRRQAVLELLDRVEGLERALEPFAKRAAYYDRGKVTYGPEPCANDFLAARQALTPQRETERKETTNDR